MRGVGLRDQNTTSVKEKHSMKFQFQFAGANVSRPAPRPKRRAMWAVYATGALLLGLAAWQYIHYLQHGTFWFSKPAAVAPAAAPAKIIAPQVVPARQPAEQLPPALKKAADDTIAAAVSLVAEAIKNPAAPVAPTVSAEPVASTQPVTAQPQVTTVVSVSVPVVATPPKPRTFKPKPPETPEQKLQRAGQLAFNNLMSLANKYPDAYGFTATDVFSETTMGKAIPVYTVSEGDRVSYKKGQPVEPILKSANQWVFPVYAGSRLCCMVQVSYNGHDYVPGSGNKFLALAWNKINERWSESDGYHIRLVVNPGIPGYYFSIPELPEQNLTDTYQMFLIHPNLSPAEVILASWR